MVNSEQLSVNSTKYRVGFIILLFTIHYLLFPDYCFAQEETTVTSDTLEYTKSTSTYIAKGSVKMKSEGRLIEADEMSYNVQTSDVIASGNVRYDDAQMIMTARQMELNLDNNTGRLYDGSILFKEDNYHISGKSIEKKSEKNYFAPEATFSTCDGPVPAWSFKGKDVDLLYQDRLKARIRLFTSRISLPSIALISISLSMPRERQDS